MSEPMSRRSFLERSATAAMGSALAAAAGTGVQATRARAAEAGGGKPTLKKSLLFGLLPASMSVADRFKLAVDLGFEGIEIQTTPEPKAVDELKAGAEKAGIRIHSVMNMAHWGSPLSSADPAVVEKSLEGLRVSLHNAKDVGADTVLLVPAVVNSQTRYQDAYERSQREIRKVLPLARELGVVIAIEEVWNKFLLSPLEFARYVDEFKDPFLQAYFDTGNIMLYGFPQDWILTLGPRIRRIHLKDFKNDKRQFIRLRDGDVEWPAVRKALAEINYNGFLTFEPNYSAPELDRGDREYLADIVKRIDLIFQGK